MQQQSTEYDGYNDNDSYPQEQASRMSALNLKWTLGFNFTINNGVHNLTNESRKEIIYASAHTGVIYDYENNSQRLLQGHCNKITCTDYNSTQDIIITADSGQDSMLVIWDAKTGVPKKTIFDPHPNGTLALDISADGQFIVTLSKEENSDSLQSISLWNWQESSKPIVTCEIYHKIQDYQNHIKFNQDNTREFVTTGKKRLIFWSWEPQASGFEFYSPAFQHKKYFTQTVFIPNSTQAVTGTNDGFIVVWDISLIMEDYSQPEERRAIKVVNLINSSSKVDPQVKSATIAINILKIQDQYLVVGTSNGSIRYYDFQYRIIAWFEEIDVGSISSISFAQNMSVDQMYSRDQDTDGIDDDDKPFLVPDFVVVDQDARIVMLKANLFEEIDRNKKKGTLLMKQITSPITCISVMPNSNFMVLSCEDGALFEWNYIERQNILSPFKQFESDSTPTCVDYSPNGKFLSVATKNGQVIMYDVEKQEWVSTLSVSETDNKHPKITMQTFANDSKHLATMDEDYSVCLFKIDYKFFQSNRPKEWIFGGKMRIHTLPIRSIAFAESMNDKGDIKLRLFSVAEDKKMVEYDVHGSSYKGLNIVNSFVIEQEYNPSACIQYPCNLHKEDVLLTVNEEYKIKLWQMISNNHKINKKTCLGPTYGGPINKLLCLTSSNINNMFAEKYLAYSTKEKVVGLIKLPLEGNPNNTIGLIAHPGQITDITASSDGKFLMTSGGDDLSTNIWSVDVDALEQSFMQDQQALGEDPYPHFLQGGVDGQTYRDLKDFFYYAQIRANKEDSTQARKLDGKVPLDRISEMMRALGYYPTEKEITNMINEIKYSKYLETNGQFVEELNLDIFVKLFVNHRPVYGIVKQQIEEAIQILAQESNNDSLTRAELLEILQKEGEKMTLQEIKEKLCDLRGEESTLEEILQEKIDPSELINDILGFENMDETPQEQGEKDSYEIQEQSQEEGSQFN